MEDRGFSGIDELFDQFDKFRVGLADMHGRKNNPRELMSRIGIILCNLRQQVQRIVSIALDAPQDEERERLALRCEGEIIQLGAIYDATEKDASRIAFLDRQAIDGFAQAALTDVDRISGHVRELFGHYAEMKPR